MVDHSARAREPHEVDYGELPELTRALRALGSPRRNAGALQTSFFQPLLDARRAAEKETTPEGRVRSFDATELHHALGKTLDTIVAQWPDPREAARRAIRAHLAERLQEYEASLRRLGGAAAAVIAADADSRLSAWREWTASLQAVFRCADRAWEGIHAATSKPAPPRPR